ncbi:MAG: universal stress protein [Burkholderiaceae bacterium]|nr:universal stress protein [Burkholderiaceae bacterium]
MNGYRRILAIVNGSARTAAVLRMAGDLARHHDAALTVGFCLDPLTGVYVTPEISASVVQMGVQQREDARARVVEAAQAEAGRSGLELPIIDIDAGVGGSALMQARVADLVVMGQRDDDDPTDPAPDIGPRIIMGAGVPVLFVPYAGEFACCGKRVLIAWAGTRESTRALHDALPMMREAEWIEVMQFIDAADADGPDSLDEAIALLAGHGLKAMKSRQVLRTPSIGERILSPGTADASVAEILLSRVADERVDLLVMGAYGHARALETILGGVTRTVLNSMTVTTMMSH